jgi:hypothetical protein
VKDNSTILRVLTWHMVPGRDLPLYYSVELLEAFRLWVVHRSTPFGGRIAGSKVGFSNVRGPLGGEVDGGSLDEGSLDVRCKNQIGYLHWYHIFFVDPNHRPYKLVASYKKKFRVSLIYPGL